MNWLCMPILPISHDIMKIFITISLIFFLVTLTIGCENDQQREKPVFLNLTDAPLRIGVLGPMSGSNKKLGENGLAGIKTALKYYGIDNAKSGIQLVVKDDHNRPVAAREAFVDLIEKEKVVAVLLLSVSRATLALEDLAKKYETPVFAILSTHPDIAGEQSYISQLMFDDQTQGLVAALYVRDELLINRVAVIIDNQDPHSLSLAQQFINTYTATGGFPIEIAYHKNKQIFGTRLKALQDNEIRFVYAPIKAENIKNMAEKLIEIEYQPTLMGSDGQQAVLVLNYPSVLKQVDGMLATNPYSSEDNFTTFGREIKDLFSNSFDSEGTAIAALGAEGTSILVSAISRCGEQVTGKCVHSKLRSVTDFVGLQSKVTINRNGKAERPVFITRLEKNKLRRIVKVY